MGGGALLFVLFTRANPKVLIILYSINVFLTFTLSQLGMCIHWLKTRNTLGWKRKLSINGVGLVLTSGILVMMVYFKVDKGGWVTLLITGLAVVISFLVRSHYESVRKSIRELDMLIDVSVPNPPPEPPPRCVGGPTAVLLVGGFNGLGIHSFLTVLRLFPYHFKNFVFVSVGVIDFEEFKGKEEIEHLRRRTLEGLEKYVQRSQSMGLYAEHRFAVGTDLVDEVERIAQGIVKDFPGAIFFGGQLVFHSENVLTRSLHSQAAFEIQRRLQLSGLAMVLLPVRVRDFKPA
jgi:hypothetical protein